MVGEPWTGLYTDVGGAIFEPSGRIYLAGEHLSHMTGWQAGAFESAWMQIEKLHNRVVKA